MPKFPTKRLFWLPSDHTAEQGGEEVNRALLSANSLPPACHHFAIAPFGRIFFLPAFLFSRLTSALISLSIFPLSLLPSQTEGQGKQWKCVRQGVAGPCMGLSMCRHFLPVPDSSRDSFPAVGLFVQ